ncbi:unnamed protein product, partial [Vitis vinifera]
MSGSNKAPTVVHLSKISDFFLCFLHHSRVLHQSCHRPNHSSCNCICSCKENYHEHCFNVIPR